MPPVDLVFKEPAHDKNGALPSGSKPGDLVFRERADGKKDAEATPDSGKVDETAEQSPQVP